MASSVLALPVKASALSSLSLSSFIPSTLVVRIAVSVTAILVTIFTLCYLITWIRFIYQRCLSDTVTIPPIIPYMVPFLGNAIGFALDPRKCITANGSVRVLVYARKSTGKAFTDAYVP